MLLTVGALVAGTAVWAGSEQDARIVQPSATSRQALQAAVAGMLGRRRVSLAEDALTTSPRLVIEPTPLRDVQGMRVQGRETRSTEGFRLVLVQGRCVLVHERTRERRELGNTQCEPVSEPGMQAR